MEAARILTKLGLKPKRTIRSALLEWRGAGLYGSYDYHSDIWYHARL